MSETPPPGVVAALAVRPRVVVATRNRGELREILALLNEGAVAETGVETGARTAAVGGGEGGVAAGGGSAGAAGAGDEVAGAAGGGLACDLVTIDQLAPDAVLAEDEGTFEGNALAKARQAAAATGLPALADDSGLEVDALGGAPGVHSARYAGEPSDDARNNAKLLEAMRAVPAAARTARFRCVAAFVDPARQIELWREGTCPGEILTAPRGTEGFGYDPLFLVPSLSRTMAELPLAPKNTLSHRAAAFRALATALATTGALRPR